MAVLRKIIEGFMAGLLIAIGGAVYLACENKVVGAVFFSVALLSICMKGYSLFTGKVGYLPEKHGKEEFSVLFLGLLGNFLATLLFGLLLSAALPNLHATAAALAAGKLGQLWWQTLIRAFFCGVLMYLAVSTYRDNKTPLGILFCVPVFILSGFEHSIADMAYFATAREFSPAALLFLLLVLVGNAVGGMFLPALRLLTAPRKKEESAGAPASSEEKTEVSVGR